MGHRWRLRPARLAPQDHRRERVRRPARWPARPVAGRPQGLELGTTGRCGLGPGTAPATRAAGRPGRCALGGDRPARRAADARLPDHPGDREAQRRRLEAEPRLGVPDTAATRGRGSGPGRRSRRAGGSTGSPTGPAVAAERADEFASLWQGMAPSDDDTQLGDLVFQVGAAFVHVARTGNPEQLAEARKVLARTKADLYKILGDDQDDTADDGGGRDGAADAGRHRGPAARSGPAHPALHRRPAGRRRVRRAGRQGLCRSASRRAAGPVRRSPG